MNAESTPSTQLEDRAAERAEAPSAPALPQSLRTWRKVRENCEAVLAAIILALIIRHFSLEAFEIPTGSMAQGLHGIHVDAECPNCGTEHALGLDIDNETNRVQRRNFRRGYFFDGACGECGTEFEQAIDDDTGKGPPALVDCPRCSRLRPPADNRGFRPSAEMMCIATTCTACGYRFTQGFEPRDCLGGHRILVNKFIYQLREPRRWEVIVFKFNRQRNYIKRLIGLPGEEIQVVDGDIHIDGTIERKPDSVQDELWFPVYDSGVPSKGYVRTPLWHAGPGWRKEDAGGGYRFDASGAPAALAYAGGISNDYPYNSAKYSELGGAGADYVRDVRILANFTVERGAGTIEFDIANGTDHYRCVVPTGDTEDGPARFELERRAGGGSRGSERSIATLLEFDGAAVPTGIATEFDYYLADRRLVLRRDGVLLAELPFDAALAAEPWNRQGTSVQIIARGTTGDLARVRLFRDIHYTSAGTSYKHAVREPFSIPDDGYFAMGDNSPYSQDSRVWGALHRQNLLGRALSIFWPALPHRWDVGFIR
ncbi:MAG: S26 family signal peptidase [Planctomycetes bacterium]|nr:S26 family signal peptidase [Planctomycetota bacterium]